LTVLERTWGRVGSKIEIGTTLKSYLDGSAYHFAHGFYTSDAVKGEKVGR